MNMPFGTPSDCVPPEALVTRDLQGDMHNLASRSPGRIIVLTWTSAHIRETVLTHGHRIAHPSSIQCDKTWYLASARGAHHPLVTRQVGFAKPFTQYRCAMSVLTSTSDYHPGRGAISSMAYTHS
jgi:hypothetical protein